MEFGKRIRDVGTHQSDQKADSYKVLTKRKMIENRAPWISPSLTALSLRTLSGNIMWIASFSQHEADGGEAEERERLAVEAFPVLGQAGRRRPGPRQRDARCSMATLFGAFPFLTRVLRRWRCYQGPQFRERNPTNPGGRDSRDRQAVGSGQGLRRPAQALDRRTHLRLAWPLPTCISRPCVSTRIWRFSRP